MTQAGSPIRHFPHLSLMPDAPPNPIPSGLRSLDSTPDESRMAGVGPSAVPSADDDLLLDRVRAGDQQAMAQIFDRYSRMVYSVALRVLADPGHAEDVLQDVFSRSGASPTRSQRARTYGRLASRGRRNRALMRCAAESPPTRSTTWCWCRNKPGRESQHKS